MKEMTSQTNQTRIMESLKVLLCLLVLCSVVEWTQGSVGLLGDCSSASCNASLVCESNICKVMADGIATDCSSTDANCPTNAVCNNDTCSCSPGTKAENGLCTVVAGTLCSTNSDCTGVPGASYQCMSLAPCTQGMCACATGLLGWNCITLDHNVACDAADDKCDTGLGLACDNVTLTCACSNTNATYKTSVGTCTTKSLFGESCATSADCFTDIGSNGLCDPVALTCGCAAGFIQHTSTYHEHSCRAPQVGETCASSCAAVSLSTMLASDSSQGTPTCSSSQCACGTGHSIMGAVNPGIGCTDICVSNTTILDEPVGANCTDFNGCGIGGICLKCPGDANGKCYASPCATPGGGGGGGGSGGGGGGGGSGAGMVVVKGATLVLLIVLAFLY